MQSARKICVYVMCAAHALLQHIHVLYGSTVYFTLIFLLYALHILHTHISIEWQSLPPSECMSQRSWQGSVSLWQVHSLLRPHATLKKLISLVHAALAKVHIIVMCQLNECRLWPRPASFFFGQPAQESSFFAEPDLASPLPQGQLATGVLDRNSPEPSSLQWRSKPERFAVR